MHLLPLLLLAAPVLASTIIKKPSSSSSSSTQDEATQDQAREELLKLAGNYTTAASLLTPFPTCSHTCIGAYYDYKFSLCGVPSSALASHVANNTASPAEQNISWGCICAGPASTADTVQERESTMEEQAKEAINKWKTAESCIKSLEEGTCAETETRLEVAKQYAKFESWCELSGNNNMYAQMEPAESDSAGVRVKGGMAAAAVGVVGAAAFLML